MSDKQEVIREWVEGVIKSAADVSARNDLDNNEIGGLFVELAAQYPKQSFEENEAKATAIGLEMERMNLAGTISTNKDAYRALSDELEKVTAHLDKTTGAR